MAVDEAARPVRGRETGILPHSAMGRERLRRIAFVFTDVDDRLTNNGGLPGVTCGALERLSQAGLHIVPVTGRPASWCGLIARLWPVSAVIGDNGAFYFVRNARED